MKHLLYYMLFCICAFPAVSQQDSLLQEQNGSGDLINVKVDFTNLINPKDPSLLFSLEYFLRDNLSINHEAGYVVVAYSRSEEINEPMTSFKTRHELRWFFSDTDDHKSRIYTSLNFQYRYLAMEDRYTLGYACGQAGGRCEYLKNFVGTIKTDRYVAQVRLGAQAHLSRRLIFELDAGLGCQWYMLRRSSVNGGRFVEPNRFFQEDSFGTSPYISISGKLGYVLFKQ